MFNNHLSVRFLYQSNFAQHSKLPENVSQKMTRCFLKKSIFEEQKESSETESEMFSFCNRKFPGIRLSYEEPDPNHTQVNRNVFIDSVGAGSASDHTETDISLYLDTVAFPCSEEAVKWVRMGGL